MQIALRMMQVEVQTRCKLHLDLHHSSANRDANCTWICTLRVLFDLKNDAFEGVDVGLFEGVGLGGFDGVQCHHMREFVVD